MDTREALKMAKDAGLDLVEVSPHSSPPVCKIADYGKMKYDEKKKEKAKKASSNKTVTKEMKFRPKTEEHDLGFKLRHVERFLSEGNRCLLSVQFKGREKAHPGVGRDLLERISVILADYEILRPPKYEGGQVSMLVGPKRT